MPGNQGKQQLSNWQMFNINFGYLGIQLAWALQFANISGVFKFLGASDAEIPILWLAGPVTGLLIPPVIGYISDFTWVKFLGRRRFYIFVGIIIAFSALLVLPHTKTLTHAVLLVWLLDSGLNIAMHPYRALIADVTPINQQTKCFSILTIASGLGSAIAFITPWLLALVYISANKHSIPYTIEWAFLGGAVVLLCSNIWTIINTEEYKSFKNRTSNNTKKSFSTIKSYFYMPEVMQDLIKVEFFTWIGMFSFIIYYALGISQNIYNLPPGVNISDNAEYSILLQRGVELCGLHSCFYITISTIFAVLLSRLTLFFERKNIYAVCLALGGIGLISASFASNSQQLLASILLVGLAWGAAVTLPFAILSSGVPQDRVGWYMGYYNLFVVIPQMVVACTFGYIIDVFFADQAMSVIALGGLFMLTGALFAYRVRDPYQEVLKLNKWTNSYQKS